MRTPVGWDRVSSQERCNPAHSLIVRQGKEQGQNEYNNSFSNNVFNSLCKDHFLAIKTS